MVQLFVIREQSPIIVTALFIFQRIERGLYYASVRLAQNKLFYSSLQWKGTCQKRNKKKALAKWANSKVPAARK